MYVFIFSKKKCPSIAGVFRTQAFGNISDKPYLINPLVCNDCKGRWIEKHMVVLVLLPKWKTDMAETMVGKLVEV